MNGDPTVSDSFGYGLSFLGDVIFKWIPSMVATIVGTADPSIGTTTLKIGEIGRPIRAGEFSDLLAFVSAPEIYNDLTQGWYTFVLISLGISVLFLGISAYCAIRIYFLRQQEAASFRAAQQSVAAKDVPKTHLRWNKIIEQAHSGADHDWRLAILEADIMLNELLDVNGYRGETMAEKMKQVDRATFNSIDAAWEAHKARNRIVHEGAAHKLSQREVRHIIGLYAQVFKEFGYIQ